MEYVRFNRKEYVPAPVLLQERYVRCYLIASYSDMKAERRLLAQEVFPTLRVRCMQIGVHFVEVDYGWGVVENVAENKGCILNRLLELRQNVRTYVIGLLGERYGYKYLHDTDQDECGNLDPLFLNRRPTVFGMHEVEFDSIPFSEKMHKAFFYFRDARYFDQVFNAVLNRGTKLTLCSQVDSLDARKSLASEGLLSRERLSHMKSKVRMSPLIPVKENYSDPEEVAAMILSDLTAQISADFPNDYTSENVLQSDDAASREYEEYIMSTFVGRESEMNFVDERVLAIQTHPQPLVICGLSFMALIIITFQGFGKGNHLLYCFW